MVRICITSWLMRGNRCNTAAVSGIDSKFRIAPASERENSCGTLARVCTADSVAGKPKAAMISLWRQRESVQVRAADGDEEQRIGLGGDDRLQSLVHESQYRFILDAWRHAASS